MPKIDYFGSKSPKSASVRESAPRPPKLRQLGGLRPDSHLDSMTRECARP